VLRSCIDKSDIETRRSVHLLICTDAVKLPAMSCVCFILSEQCASRAVEHSDRLQHSCSQRSASGHNNIEVAGRAAFRVDHCDHRAFYFQHILQFHGVSDMQVSSENVKEISCYKHLTVIHNQY